MSLVRRRIDEAPPARWVLRKLEPGLRPRLLESQLPGGWGSDDGHGAPLGSGVELLFVEPEIELRGGAATLEVGRRWLSQWETDEPASAWLVGSLSYDLGREFEQLPELAIDDVPVPPVCLGGYRAVYLRDSMTRGGEVVGSDPIQVGRLLARVGDAAAWQPTRARPRLSDPRARTSELEFLRSIRKVQAKIAAGDVYQVNLSRRLDFDEVRAAELPALYDALCSTSPAPFAAYLDAGDFAVLSNSPERFLRVRDSEVETCPIKGTRPRAEAPAEDCRLAAELLRSGKDHAEHLMIVDLERNDLGRVCQVGSVRVRELAALRSFPTVHHLVSRVQGRLLRPRDWPGLIAATFPGGSVTGAPKIRAMELIEELEPVRRGIYTGAVGYLDAAGGLDLSIAIRTAVWRGDRLHLQLGGGIVADSDPEAELRETCDKGRAFEALWRPHGCDSGGIAGDRRHA